LRQAVILAGGKGTRLAARLDGRPKPLVDVLGKPLLERQVEQLKAAGFSRIDVLVNHKAEQIQAFCDSRDNWGLDIRLIDDGEPKGTAGAVLAVLDRMEDEFLVVYGDTLFDIDLGRFIAFHEQDPDAAATLFLHPNDHPHDSDLVELDAEGRIRAFHPKPHAAGAWLPNMVNAALYAVRRRGLEPAKAAAAGAGIFDFAQHAFPWLLSRGARLRGYVSSEYIKDIGTPDRLDRACEALASGKVAAASLRTRQAAVFLDRDGTLNRENGFVSRPEMLEPFPFIAPAVRKLNRSGLRAVLITNQPVIARGDCTPQELDQIHAKLETLLGREGAFLDRIYYCPHHPHGGYPGEVAELKIECDCRKPKPGLILRAAEDLNIDLASSWMVGDSERDLRAASAAGVRSVLVRTGKAEPNAEALADFAFDDLEQAVDFIVGEQESLSRRGERR
jgi:D,D-heptose 1,7-bisphosphate phosphatase